jgi:type II secretory pathway component GspD/PulD (secretin)
LDIVQIVDALKELNIIEGTSGTTGTGTSRRTTTINRAGGDAVPQPQVVQQQMAGGESANGYESARPAAGGYARSDQFSAYKRNARTAHTISQIIATSTANPVETAIPYRFTDLKSRPEKRAETLNSLIEKTVKRQGRQNSADCKVHRRQYCYRADVATFSVIVYASKKNQDWIGNLIKTLDTRRPQGVIACFAG